MLLKNALVYNADFEPVHADVAVEGDTISAVGGATAAGEVLDLTGCTVVPGLIDIHTHGCAGHDASEGTPEALQTISRCMIQRGVTSFCPTSMTLPFETLDTMFRTAASLRGREEGAYFQGINMEGPYIAMSKKGAQNADYVRKPDAAEFKRLYDNCGGFIRLVDIAPEEDGAEKFVRTVNPICTVSIAHTAADYDIASTAIGWGVQHATHLYNAMSGLTHRKPGVVGAVFDAAQDKGVRAEMICDGFHIHPAALRIAFRQLGEDQSIIISDSMCAAGYKDGDYDLGGQTVYVRDGKALLADGTIAASTSNLHEEFKNVLRFGIPLKQALKSVTINPARAIRVDDVTGSIAVGKRADLVAMDADWNLKLVVAKGHVKVNNL